MKDKATSTAEALGEGGRMGAKDGPGSNFQSLKTEESQEVREAGLQEQSRASSPPAGAFRPMCAAQPRPRAFHGSEPGRGFQQMPPRHFAFIS